jgi:hypothetical protein
MALEHRWVSIGGPSTYTLIHIATCACTRAHAHIGGAAAHYGRACVDDRPRAVRRGARRAESGEYVGQARDRGGVPRADVRVEGRRRLEHLRAETATLLGGGVKGSHALARMRARPRTHTSARAHARTPGRVRAACRPRRYARTTIGAQGRVCACTVYKYRPIGGCQPMAVSRGKLYSHTRSAASYRQPAHTGTLVCMGEAPTCNPRACIAQEPYL